MGTRDLLTAVGVLALAWPVSAALAAPVCETAVTSAMQHPPNPRVVTIEIAESRGQWVMVSVTARGAQNPMVSSVQIGNIPVVPVATRDAAMSDGVRVFQRINPPVGEQTVTIEYDSQPDADAVMVVTCRGVHAGRGVRGVSILPTGDRREVLTLGGEDNEDEEVRVIGSEGNKTELRFEAPGFVLQSLGVVRP